MLELSILIVTGVNKKSLLISYKFFNNEILNDKIYNKIGKLFFINEIKKTLEKRIESNANKIKNIEVENG